MCLLLITLGFILTVSWGDSVGDDAGRDDEGSLVMDGQVRTWLAHLPPRPRWTRSPVVIVLHGRGGTSTQVSKEAGWSEFATQRGFIAVCPAAYTDADDLPRWNHYWNRGGQHEPRAVLLRLDQRGWNAYWNQGEPHGAGRFPADDPAFIRTLIERLPALYRADPRRIYLCGYSNGGELAATMVGYAPERLAAVGLIAATVGGRDGLEPRTAPVPSLPIPVLHIQGMRDESMPYEGGGRRNLLSSRESALFWARAYGATATPSELEELPVGRRQTWRGSSPRAVSTLLSISNWGHGWPETFRGGPISAREELWRFFSQHQLP